MSSELSVSARLGANAFTTDKTSHLRIDDPSLCEHCVLKPCIRVCPAQVYSRDGERIRIQYENCIELGACRIACHEIGNRALIWSFPRGSKGIGYRYG